MQERIGIGFHAFVRGSDEEFGAIRAVSSDGKELTVYVENGGDFVVPRSAVREVHDQKVVFDRAQLEPNLQSAIGRAHDSEEPDL